MNDLPRMRMPWPSIVGALLLLAFGPVAQAQSPRESATPLEIESVQLDSVEGGADLIVRVSETVGWKSNFESDGSLTLLFPRSVPGPRALDLSPAGGLVEKVEVGFALPGGVPTSRVVVRGREGFRHNVVRGRGFLRVELRSSGRSSKGTRSTDTAPAAAQRTESEQSTQTVESPQQPSASSQDDLQRSRSRVTALERELARLRADSTRVQEELQARLNEVGRESEARRQRVSELHADRLQLIEDLRVARQSSSRDESAAGERDDARAEVDALQQRLTRLEAELSRAAADAEHSAVQFAALGRRRQEDEARLTRLAKELESLRGADQRNSELADELQSVTAERDRLRGEVVTARQAVANARGAQEAEAQTRQTQLDELKLARDLAEQGLAETKLEVERLRTESNRLSRDLAAARSQVSEENDTRSVELQSLRDQHAGLQDATRNAELRAERALAELEASRLEGRRLEQELVELREGIGAEESEIVDHLRSQLEASRGSEAELRGWLARAPRILGVHSMTVSGGVSPCLSFRPQPSQESPVLDCLAPGTAVDVLNMRAEWLRVRLADRREGWVSQRFMEPAGSSDLARMAAAQEAAHEEIEGLRAERDRLSTRLADLERESAAARSDAAAAQAARLEEAEALRAEWAAEVDAAEAQISQLESRVTAAHATTEELRASLSDSEAEVETLKIAAADTVELGRRLADLEGSSGDRLARLQAELESTSQAMIEAQATVAALQQSNDRLAGERLLREEADSERKRVAAELETARLRIADLEAAVSTAELNGERLSASLQVLEEQLAAVGGVAEEAEELRARAGGQSNAIGEMSEQLTGLRAELASAQSALAKSRSDVEAAEKEARDRMLRLTELAGIEDVVVSDKAAPCLKLRTAPGVASDPFDCVDPGTRLTLLDLEGEWMEVAGTGDRRGWVSSSYIELEGQIEQRRAAADLKAAQGRIEELEEARGRAAEVAADEIASLRAELELATRAGSVAEAQKAELDQVREELESERQKLADAEATRNQQARELDAARERIAALERSHGEARESVSEELAILRSQLDEAVARRGEAEARSAVFEPARAEAFATKEAAGAEPVDRAPADRLAEIPVSAAPEAELPESAPAGGRLTALEPLSRSPREPSVAEVMEDLLVPEDEPRPLVRSADLAAVARGWAEAWSAQDVEGYLSFYSESFQPAYGMSRSRWEAQRRERLRAPAFVEVDLSSIGVRIDGPDRAAVLFVQSYRSNTFEDVVSKSLELALEGGEWRIVEEIAE